jgi:hypothetical protein
MSFQNIHFKAPRSHAVQEWTVYPWVESDNQIVIQSDNKIARIWRKEQKIQISKASKTGYTRVSDLMDRPLQDCPVEVIAQFNALQPTGKVVRLC